MAIYRSDQAQVTFQTEAAPGGYIERASAPDTTGAAGSAVINIAAGHPAGTRVLTVDSLSGITIGEFIQIGTGTTSETEIRVVEHINDTTGLVLDAPTAFFHPDNDPIAVVTGVGDTTLDQYINLVPGVYETVDTPDPEMAIEGRYLLGTASKRNFFAAYSGQQSFSGSIGGFVLLNGKPLRYPIGRVNTTTTYLTTAGGASPTHGGNLSAATKKGDLFVNIDTMLATLTANGFILFTGSTTAATTSTATSEIRKYVGADEAGAAKTNAQLDYPLQFDHANDEFVYFVMTAAGGATIALSTEATHVVPYTHSIRETVDLDSVTWHVHMRASDEDATKDFDRRYFGGKIGSLTLSAEESGMVTAGWDSVNFLGMVHNQKSRSLSADSNVSGTYTNAINDGSDINASATGITVDSTVGLTAGNLIRIDDEEMEIATVANGTTITVVRARRGTLAAAHLDNAVITKVVAVPFYSPMQSITSGEVQFPATEPYYFSQGEVTLFGQTIARIRSFSLSITNNEEPRYYVSKQMGRRRGPTEIKEQRREYSLAVTLGLPDATAANTAQNTVFNELLLEGNYGSVGDFNRQGKQGFNVVLSLTRGNVVTGFEDKILITIPDDGAATTGGNQQGAFIRTAPHNITEDNPFQVEADILFRNLKIDVQDAEHYYP